MSHNAIIMVGFPASGKSTMTKTISENMAAYYVVVDFDTFVHNFANQDCITYNEAFQRYAKDAQLLYENTLTHHVSNGHDIIIDKTNLTSKGRRKIVNKLRRANYTSITCVHIPTSVDVCKKRAVERAKKEDKHIPSHVFDSMDNYFTPPTKDEGFTSIYTFGQSQRKK
jgi:predicted kinase